MTRSLKVLCWTRNFSVACVGEYTMKMTMLEMEPGAAIPEHTHKGPGMRYVLEGAIAIDWKNGKTETFKAVSRRALLPRLSDLFVQLAGHPRGP